MHITEISLSLSSLSTLLSLLSLSLSLSLSLHRNGRPEDIEYRIKSSFININIFINIKQQFTTTANVRGM